MKPEKLAAEFTKSTNKAIEKLSKKFGFTEDEIQIAVMLDENKESLYKVCKNYMVHDVIEDDEVVILPAVYVLAGAKSTVLSYINKVLIKITEEKQKPLTVFILKSKKNPGQIRIMLYVAGTYDSDMTAEQIIELNN